MPDELNNANLTENADKLVFSNLDKMFLCRTLNRLYNIKSEKQQLKLDNLNLRCEDTKVVDTTSTTCRAEAYRSQDRRTITILRPACEVVVYYLLNENEDIVAYD